MGANIYECFLIAIASYHEYEYELGLTWQGVGLSSMDTIYT
jgi:hypothetical protein